MVEFGLSLDCTQPNKRGKGVKPEVWALHETCHVRWAHMSPGIQLDSDAKHKEVAQCMKDYSAKERR
jgi:hypothetical protein